MAILKAIPVQSISPQLSIAECRFKDFLDTHHYSYVFIEQSPLTFSGEFRRRVKRPDFLVDIEGIGTIVIDVKNKFLSRTFKNFTLSEGELRKLVEYQNLSRHSVWFAISNEICDYLTWYFIRLDRVEKIGETRKRRDTGEVFRVFKITDCITIGHDDSLQKLTS